MPKFKKSSLTYQYKWPPNNAYSPTSLDEDMIETDNGYEVLNFINNFFLKEGLTSVETFKRIEFLLHEHLPPSINTRVNIALWIRKNWNRHFY
jgi:hypothetical protein